MNNSIIRNNALQELCRNYLRKLRGVAHRVGLGEWLESMIEANERELCVATEEECELLARCVDDERLHRTDVPKFFGVSYRFCYDKDIFGKIKKLHRTGIYSKVDSILYKAEQETRQDGSK